MPKELIELDDRTAAVFERKGYDVTQKLAQGAFGQVYKAKKVKTGQLSAVKVMEIDKLSDKMKKVFVPRELKISTELKHPNILNVFDIFKAAGKYYIFMEFAGGGSLSEKCEGTPANTKLAKKWFRQTADALNYMHEDMMMAHRDIKLENVLLDSEGNAKLSDFGFSRVHEGGLARTILGTTPYYCPQLIAGQYDPFKADVWAMGVMLYGLLIAKFAFSDFPRTKKPPKEVIVKWFKSMERRVYRNRVEYQKLDSGAKNLLDGCLAFLEVNRFTATKILKHKWLRN